MWHNNTTYEMMFIGQHLEKRQWCYWDCNRKNNEYGNCTSIVIYSQELTETTIITEINMLTTAIYVSYNKSN